MKTYTIRRRAFWKTPEELQATAARSKQIGDEQMSDSVRWIRSYVVQEANGTLGTTCIYQAVDEDAIREHAERVGMPADEIAEVADTVIVREDPKDQREAA